MNTLCVCYSVYSHISVFVREGINRNENVNVQYIFMLVCVGKWKCIFYIYSHSMSHFLFYQKIGLENYRHSSFQTILFILVSLMMLFWRH